MSSGRVYSGFFAKQIMGVATLRDDVFNAVRQEVRDMAGNAIGEAIFDATGSGLVVTDDGEALNDRRLDVSGDLPALNDDGQVLRNQGSSSALDQWVDGARTVTVHDPDWFTALPYENDSGETYNVYLRPTSFPIDVGIARDGGRGYSRWVDAPGVSINPTTVTDTGTGLRLSFSTSNELVTTYGVQPWLTSNTNDTDWSYDAVVYLDTDVVGVRIATDDPDTAIALSAKLVKATAGGGWRIDITGYLGQSTPSTTASHYRVVVLGPIITTTDFDSDPEYVHVATVTSGVTETVDHSGQVVIRQYADVVAYFDDAVEDLFYKGLITRPTVSASGTGPVTVGSGGEVILNGAVQSIPTASINVTETSATVYLYLDGAAAVVSKTTSWATANGTNNVPFYRYEVDGGGSITTRSNAFIARSWKKHNAPMSVVVSSQATHFPNFASIREALSYFRALKDGGAEMPSAEIVIIGDVEESATIDVASLLGVENITFRGSSGAGVFPGSSMSSVGVGGARIVWNFTTSGLFDLPSGVTLRNWKFSGLTFSFENSSTNDTRGVVRIASGSTAEIAGLTFENCVFDLAPAMQPEGGANGRLAHVLYNGGTTNDIKDVIIKGCSIASFDAPVYNAGTKGIVGLRFTDNNVVGPGFSAGGTTPGGVVDLATTDAASHWIVKNNRFDEIDGPCVHVNLADGIIVSDNFMETHGINATVKIGNTGTPTESRHVIISNNVITPKSFGATPAVQIAIQDPSGDHSGLVITGNIIDGGGSFYGNSVGMSLSQSSTGTHRGWIVHSNIITGFETAMTGIDLGDSIIHHNVLISEFNGIALTGQADRVSVVGNVIEAETLGISLVDGVGCVVAANSVEMDGATNGEALKLGASTYGVVVGNALIFTVDHTGGGVAFDTAAGAQFLSVVGNLGYSLGTGTATWRVDGDYTSFVGTMLKNVQYVGDSGATKNTHVGVISKGFNWSGSDDAVMVGCLIYDGAVALASGADYLMVGSRIISGLTNSMTKTGGGATRGIGLVMDAIVDASASTTGLMTLVGVVANDVLHSGTGAFSLIGSYVDVLTVSESTLTHLIGNYINGVSTIGADVDTTTAVGNVLNAAMTVNGSDPFVAVGNSGKALTLSETAGDAVVVGWNTAGTLEFKQTTSGKDTLVVGSQFGTVTSPTGTDSELRLIGSFVDGAITHNGGPSDAEWWVVGCVIDGNVDIDNGAKFTLIGTRCTQVLDSITADSMLVGNRVRASTTTTINGDENIVVGNRFDDNLTIAGAATGVVVVGNRVVGGTLTNSGAGTVASNET